MTLRIGLTGGIGSGKSTVAALLVRGVATSSIRTRSRVDSLHRAVLRSRRSRRRSAPNRVVRRCPRSRPHASSHLCDPEAKRRLEAILHPLIGIETERLANAASTEVLVFDVPLLAESSHWRDRVGRVVVVDCEQSTQMARVMQRSGLNAAAVQAIIEQQAPRAKRRACADAVIHNDTISLETLTGQVAALWQAWAPTRT